MHNHLIFFPGEATALDVWPQVIRPPQPTALAAPLQSCIKCRDFKKPPLSTRDHQYSCFMTMKPYTQPGDEEYSRMPGVYIYTHIYHVVRILWHHTEVLLQVHMQPEDHNIMKIDQFSCIWETHFLPPLLFVPPPQSLYSFIWDYFGILRQLQI